MNQQILEIDPRSRQRLSERFGHAVEGWFTQLSAVLVALVDRWHLDLGEQIPHGSVSIIFRCRLADGRPAVLKVSPDRARISEETTGLRAWRTSRVLAGISGCRLEAQGAAGPWTGWCPGWCRGL